MASATWKGSISFGLLTIPINLYTAARSQRVELHQVHRECNTRLRQPLFCPTCNRQVDRSEVIRGYEDEDGQYILVESDEIKKIEPKSGRTMEILAFVKEEEIDPIYYDFSYLAMPDKEHQKPYILLVKALEDTGRVGIATVTMHQREYTVFIRPRKHGLTVHTMYFQNEIRDVEGYGKTDEDIKLKPQEIKLAQQLVDSLAEKFKPQQYHDTFQENLKKLIEAKREGKTVVVEEETRRAPVIDMMEALKRSIRQAEGPGRVRKVEREKRKKVA